MSDWRPVEIYATFIKAIGELEVDQPDRITDTVNRFGAYIHLRNGRTEPLSVDYPLLSDRELRLTIRKASVILICPSEFQETSNRAMWRAKTPQAVAINTEAFSLVGDLHLDDRHGIEDHLERYPGDFIPMTNISALWVAASSSETQSLQRPFALINPTSILSFSPR